MRLFYWSVVWFSTSEVIDHSNKLNGRCFSIEENHRPLLKGSSAMVTAPTELIIRHHAALVDAEPFFSCIPDKAR